MDYLIRLFVAVLANAGVVIEKTNPKPAIESLLKQLYPFEIPLIRLGPNGDGGYLIPDDLDGIEACFSPGVGALYGFEEACYHRGIQVFLADHSIDNAHFIPESFHFLNKKIGAYQGLDMITIDQWVAQQNLRPGSDLVLQMDIEGDEYLTILNLSESLLKRFRILVIEFHSLHRLWNKSFFKTAEAAFQKILQHHYCVHIHPNNCCRVSKVQGLEVPHVMEFTFLRKDRLNSTIHAKHFPHPLDFDNGSEPTIVLPKNWYNKD